MNESCLNIETKTSSIDHLECCKNMMFKYFRGWMYGGRVLIKTCPISIIWQVYHGQKVWKLQGMCPCYSLHLSLIDSNWILIRSQIIKKIFYQNTTAFIKCGPLNKMIGLSIVCHFIYFHGDNESLLLWGEKWNHHILFCFNVAPNTRI